MKPVKQTIFEIESANSFQACVASIFEFELSQLPNFTFGTIEDYDEKIKSFCDPHGLVCIEIRPPRTDYLKGVYSIGMGLNPRGNLKSDYCCVVCLNKSIVHDPSGFSKGLLDHEIILHMIFVIKDPSKLMQLYQRG